eukprot:365192-Chlamydomonas_euryale.AAC.20
MGTMAGSFMSMPVLFFPEHYIVEDEEDIVEDEEGDTKHAQPVIHQYYERIYVHARTHILERLGQKEDRRIVAGACTLHSDVVIQACNTGIATNNHVICTDTTCLEAHPSRRSRFTAPQHG